MLFVRCNFNNQKDSGLPSIHFTTDEMGNGIPKGLLFDGSKHHLFYQSKSDSSNDNSLHWGHAISYDLINWKKLPGTIFPDSMKSAHLGNVVIDGDNTSGFGKNGNSAMIAFYSYSKTDTSQSETLYHQYLGIMCSLDEGKTWEKQTKKSILLNSGSIEYKISKVFRHEETQQWIMILTGNNDVRFYASEDLINWQFKSTFSYTIDKDRDNGSWEYTDIFPLTIEATKETKWILLVSYNSGNSSSGSGTKWVVGDFDGYAFQPAKEKIKSVDYGRDNFAGVTSFFNDKCIFIGCINNSQQINQPSDSKLSSTFTLPRKLSLVREFNGYIIKSVPIESIGQLRGKKKLLVPEDFRGIIEINEKQELPYEINLTFNTNTLKWLDFAEKFGVELSTQSGDQLVIGYNHYSRVFFISRLNAKNNGQVDKITEVDYAPYIDNQPTIEFRIIVDKTSVEFFSGMGSVVMTEKIPAKMVFNQIKLFAESGKISLLEGNIIRLKSEHSILTTSVSNYFKTNKLLKAFKQ
jgi:sucrose-6-phosphate hydrolase SacC (GH32 family)